MQTDSIKKWLLLIFVIAFSATAMAQNYTSYFTGNATNITTTTQGGICLMGGATENDDAMKWFLQRANGGDVLVLRTTGGNGYNSYLYSTLGIAVNSVETIVCNNAAASNEAYIKQKIQQAEAIWFAGGDQWTYISYWRNTAIDSLVNDAITNRNIVVGGISAGMAIQGKYYYTAQNGSVTSASALANPYTNTVTVDSAKFMKNNFLNNVITDTHYDNPDRKGRQTTFIARLKKDWNIDVKGIACDEYTAVCIDNTGIAKVYGGYPTYDDNAYFIQANCEVNNNAPETCVAGTALTWNQGNQALKVYAIKGTAMGSNTFNINNWKTGVGGDWQKWYVINGVWQSAVTTVINCATLPVKFILFTAIKNKNEVQLSWQTVNEINNKQFAVQRSKDGISFETIAIVNADRTNVNQHTYSAIDIKALTSTSYYRLQQQDIDGKIQYSEIIKMEGIKTSALTIYPNPCSNKIIYFENNGLLAEKFVVVNAVGQKIMEQKISTPYFIQSADVSTLAKGIYFVQLVTKTNTVTAKFIIE